MGGGLREPWWWKGLLALAPVGAQDDLWPGGLAEGRCLREERGDPCPEKGYFLGGDIDPRLPGGSPLTGEDLMSWPGVGDLPWEPLEECCLCRELPPGGGPAFLSASLLFFCFSTELASLSDSDPLELPLLLPLLLPELSLLLSLLSDSLSSLSLSLSER